MHYLEVLSIGNNLLTGPIPSYAFTNKTELEKLYVNLHLSLNQCLFGDEGLVVVLAQVSD